MKDFMNKTDALNFAKLKYYFHTLRNDTYSVEVNSLSTVMEWQFPVNGSSL